MKAVPAIQPFRSYQGRKRAGEVLCRWVEGGQIMTPTEVEGPIDWAEIDFQNMSILALAAIPLRGKFHSLFVNLGPQTLNSHAALTRWLTAARLFREKSGTDLVVEITEHAERGDFELALSNLRAEGIHIALDDLGEDESTFSLLYEHQWDYCKINVGLLDKAAVIEAVHSCIERNTLTVVERVEKQGQAARAQLLGIDLEQGFLSGEPQLFGCFLRADRDDRA